jgi:hypothetical protein
LNKIAASKKQATIYTSNSVVPIKILGVTQEYKSIMPDGMPGGENGAYLGSGNGFRSTEEIKLPRYANEYNGSNASANIKFIIWSAMLNPIRRITKVIMIVIFTFFIKELNRVTKLLKAITYNTAKPKE